MARFSLALLLAAGLLTTAAGVAHAHPILEEAQRLFDEADFEGALAAFGRAEEAGDLTRDDLVQLYIIRALVHHTLGNADDLETDLMRLASLDPDHEFGRQVPPVVVEAFERAKSRTTGQIAVHLVVQTQPGGVRLEARIEHDTSGIVQEIRIGARAPGNAWTQRNNAALEMPASSDAILELYAEAIGPGGALVASDGTHDEPLSGRVSELENRVVERGGGGEDGGGIIGNGNGNGNGRGGGGGGGDDGDGGLPVWPFLVGGGVLLAAGAAILIAFLISSGSNNTDLMPPIVQP